MVPDDIQSRTLPLRGALNFRDIGGLPVAGGRLMRRNIFFRSDNLSHLSDSDLRVVDALGLQTVIDLRMPGERASKPDRLPPGRPIRCISAPIYPTMENPGKFKSLLWLISGKYRHVDFEDFTYTMYTRIAFYHLEQIGNIMSLMADESNLPLLFHCNGGKDRTGFIAALLQSLAGLPWSAIMHDYLATNQLMAPYVAKFIRRSRWMNIFGFSPERMRPVLEARTAYLEEAFGSIRNKHGSVERYLNEACNVSPETLSKIKALLLEQ